ncbi:MAG: hypothetical protein MUD12_04205 [Spirochaetes bacterium]|jgi:hypothetical protein|nr:hypothetical protein [Spirochaetota bacterium]
MTKRIRTALIITTFLILANASGHALAGQDDETNLSVSGVLIAVNEKNSFIIIKHDERAAKFKASKEICGKLKNRLNQTIRIFYYKAPDGSLYVKQFTLE